MHLIRTALRSRPRGATLPAVRAVLTVAVRGQDPTFRLRCLSAHVAIQFRHIGRPGTCLVYGNERRHVNSLDAHSYPSQGTSRVMMRASKAASTALCTQKGHLRRAGTSNTLHLLQHPRCSQSSIWYIRAVMVATDAGDARGAQRSRSVPRRARAQGSVYTYMRPSRAV